MRKIVTTKEFKKAAKEYLADFYTKKELTELLQNDEFVSANYWDIYDFALENNICINLDDNYLNKLNGKEKRIIDALLKIINLYEFYLNESDKEINNLYKIIREQDKKETKYR